MVRMLALIGFCAALCVTAAQAGPFDGRRDRAFGGHDGYRGDFRGDERGFRNRDHGDRGVIVIDRHGDRWRGDVQRFGGSGVVVVDPRFDPRFDDRRDDRFGHGYRREGDRGRGVVVIDPRFDPRFDDRRDDRFGHGRRPDLDHRPGDHGRGRGPDGFRGYALTPQQRQRLWVR